MTKYGYVTLTVPPSTRSAAGYLRSVGRRLLALMRRQPVWWRHTVIVVAALYGLLMMLVLVGSPLVGVDEYFLHLRLIRPDSHWRMLGDAVVFVGQRVPASLVAGWYALRRARQLRAWYPVTYFFIAEALFVGSVLAVKIGTGRLGPQQTDDGLAVLQGGDIFPSGHVTGAVVLYGLMVMLAPRARQPLFALGAAAAAVAVAGATVTIGTHWVTDAIGGMLCGVLVLLATWALGPVAEVRRARWWHRLRRSRRGVAYAGGSAVTASRSALD